VKLSHPVLKHFTKSSTLLDIFINFNRLVNSMNTLSTTVQGMYSYMLPRSWNSQMSHTACQHFQHNLAYLNTAFWSALPYLVSRFKFRDNDFGFFVFFNE